MPSIKEIMIKILKTDWDNQNIIQDEDYFAKLFAYTTISSDFRCFEVHINKEKVDTDGWRVPNIFVMKAGKENVYREGEILQMLKGQGCSVPDVYKRLRVCLGSFCKYIILEEFISGPTLYENGSEENWRRFAVSLASFHRRLWNVNTEIVSYIPRIRTEKASIFSSERLHNVQVYNTAMGILTRCPKTFLHGDLVPTNIIISGDGIKFIDLNDGGTGQYVLDIARAITYVDRVTIKRFCPSPDDFCVAYYDVMRDQLGTYEDFRQNVRAAEFLECAAQAYDVLKFGIFDNTERAYANCLREKVRELTESLT